MMKSFRLDENLLEKWLIHEFESLHQNNSETLSKYVLSLLRQDRGENMKQFVQEELKTFLKDNTNEFVQHLFRVLEDESYKSIKDEDMHRNEPEIDRRNSYDGDYQRERSGSDEEDSRARGRLRRRYSDDAVDREENDRRDNRRDSSRDRYKNRDRDFRDRDRDRREDRHREDNWRERGNRDNYRRNNGGHRNFNSHRRNDSDHGNNNNNVAWAPPFPPNVPGGMPPPYPWNPSSAVPFYPPPFPAPYGAPPFAPVGYPPYNPYLPQGASNPSQFPPASQPPVAPEAPNQTSPPAAENNDVTTEESNKVSEEAENNEPGKGKVSYEDELFAQNQSIPPPVYPPMWGFDSNYMMYNQPVTAPNEPWYPSRNQGNNGNDNKRNNRSNNNANKNSLPENERCTLRCTGIPTTVKEEDIRAHFEAFGHIVKLEIAAMEDHHTNNNYQKQDDSPEEKKKTYNECLVQFYSAANAKKCLNSQAPVLNNRFIRIYLSNFNIILPSDVEPPSYEIMEHDKALLSQIIEPKAYDPQKRKAAAAATHTLGVTNKWRRTSTDTKVAAVPSTDNSEKNDGTSEQPSTDTAPVTVESAESIAAKKESAELKQEFEQLQTLKQQAEDILKKKEKLLMDSVEKCRQMMDKLEMSEDSDSKTSLLQNLENKIVDLQAQLRIVREQIEKGVTAIDKTPAAAVQMIGAVKGLAAGGGGRFSYYGAGRGSYGRGGGAGRGRGYGRGFNKFINTNTYQNPNLTTTGSGNPFQQAVPNTPGTANELQETEKVAE